MQYERLFIGLDPSASDEKPSGICVLNAKKKIIHLGKWRFFGDLPPILLPARERISAIGIDGPLQTPHELYRCCFAAVQPACDHRQTVPYKGRWCEQLLIQRGFRCFTTSKNSFARHWIYRCLLLSDFLSGFHFPLFEVFPLATRKILFPGLQGKKQFRCFRELLFRELQDWGMVFPDQTCPPSHDELDAVLAALTMFLEDLGATDVVGECRDGYIILPRQADRAGLA